MASQYYVDKLETLKDIFNRQDIRLESDTLLVDGRAYPIVNDIIILLEPDEYPKYLRDRARPGTDVGLSHKPSFPEDIQHQFGECWKRYPNVLPENEREFDQYFDIVDLEKLNDLRVCDLGCGMGRWTLLLQNRCKCREAILVDFSEAIFVARDLLRGYNNSLFFMGDLNNLPFRKGFADFIFSLGVLHHVPVNALELVRRLGTYSPTLLVYLYYALDNRPWYFKSILSAVTSVRLLLSSIRNSLFREMFTWFGVSVIYLPLIWAGHVLRPVGLSRYIPLADEHHWASIEGLRHHVYDRFFTRIEQRFSREQIMTLQDTFASVTISDNPGYWHFLCESHPRRAQCQKDLLS